MATYKPKRKTATSGTIEDVQFPIAAVKDLQTTLDSKLNKSGGTLTGNLTITNGSSTQAKEPSLKWKTVGANTPYVGFATDQVDGTFLLGSLKGTDYRTGLAIGGGSGNLLWKGARVTTADDLSSYQPKTDNTLNTGAKTVAGAINEVYSKSFDNLGGIDTYWEETSSLCSDEHGMTWQDSFELNTKRDLTGETIQFGTIYHKVPITAGNNVYFEVDETNQVVKINATGGGGSGSSDPCLEMPQIRFVGMPCDGWFGHVNWIDVIGQQGTSYENLKFTIEIVGGGSLQLGDTIQICRMGCYGPVEGSPDNNYKSKPHKRKLRRLAEYTITEEDLDKRFITFTIAGTNKKAMKLFSKSAVYGWYVHPIYFRVRRPKGDIQNNDSGMTVDAKFSNVVSVTKKVMNYSWENDSGDYEDFCQVILI